MAVAVSGKSYRDLIVWQRAMDFVEMLYGATAPFPKDELYGLTSQLRRASVSIPSNIAEGQGRGSPGDFQRFLWIANGSLREVETQILIARRLHYLDADTTTNLTSAAAEIGRLIHGLINSLPNKK